MGTDHYGVDLRLVLRREIANLGSQYQSHVLGGLLARLFFFHNKASGILSCCHRIMLD